MKARSLLLGLALATCVLPTGGTRAADCAPDGNVKFVCGTVNPEDLVAVPGGDWVVVSGMNGGGIHLVNTHDHQATRIFPSASAKEKLDSRTYSSCPGPLDAVGKEKISAHGINLRPGRGGVHTLYLVYHGARESIEVFDLDVKTKAPTLTWVGCVVAPESVAGNAVAPLPGDGFVVTNPYRRTLPKARDLAIAGSNSGEVWEWHSSAGWTMIPGSEGRGPNGIEVSKDGKWLYINLWPASQVVRISRGQTPVKKDVIDVTFHPDNIRWQADGSLLTAGHYAPTIEKATECLRKKCPDAAARVARLDPETMKAKEIVNYPSSDVFFGATAALQVGKEIWIGSVRGDRVARYPLR
jgi:hypothetical protein